MTSTSGSRPWSMAAALAAAVAYCSGLALLAIPASYDLAHLDDVLAASHIEDPVHLILEPGRELVAAYSWAYLAICALLATLMLFTVRQTARGRRWAHVSAGVLTASTMCCCGYLMTRDRWTYQETPDPTGGYSLVHDASTPRWLHQVDVAGPLVTVVAAVVLSVLLVLPATVRHVWK